MFLQVHEHCSVAWVPYMAGDPIIPGAVQGSILSSGTPLYVAKFMADPNYGLNGLSFGYYHPDDEMGYYDYFSYRQSAEMELLILL